MVVVTKPKPSDNYASLLESASGIQLDIGCGRNKQPGFVGIDMQRLPGVDIVHNVLTYPWPLPDDCVIRALASHLVEHIPPHDFGFIRFMDEVWRVTKPGGEFLIATPHGNSQGYLQDPTHCNPCNGTTWLYFDPLNSKSGATLWGFYRPKPWRIRSLAWDPSTNIEVMLIKRSMDEIAHLTGDHDQNGHK